MRDLFSLDPRTFCFDRSFDVPDTPDNEALAAGGILKFDSEPFPFHGLGIGLGYYSSFSLSGVVDREKGGGSAILQSDGEDISFLGEAYVQYGAGANSIVVGRQRLSTPLADDQDNRLLPTAYEAVVYRYKPADGVLLEAGYIDTFSGFGSTLDGFETPEEDWGADGLGYLYRKGRNSGVGSACAKGPGSR